MGKINKAIRGMNDILPLETPYWQHAESILRKVFTNYGYEEIRTPLLESTDLFVRSIGQATDIVEKEMYTFEDRNGESLTLRPEGTAGCVRAGIEHGLLHNQIQRFWYLGPMFRHERPQKGRYRQFHQCGVEAFGLPGPDIDCEILMMTARIWRSLGITDKVTLHLNSIGTIESRFNYRQILVDYFKKNFAFLDADSVQRLDTNPLRILDSKNPEMQELIENSPKLLDHLDKTSIGHFTQLLGLLDALQLDYTIDHRLVRGLDYYCSTVFEWTTNELGAQGAICGGGHYDGLVKEIGGKPTAAIGCAIGMERLISLLQNVAEFRSLPQVYLILIGDDAVKKGITLAEELRSGLPHLRLTVNCGGGNWSQQLKRADKSGAKLALILAEHEVKSDVVTLKHLREEKPQQEIKIADLKLFLQELK